MHIFFCLSISESWKEENGHYDQDFQTFTFHSTFLLSFRIISLTAKKLIWKSCESQESHLFFLLLLSLVTLREEKNITKMTHEWARYTHSSSFYYCMHQKDILSTLLHRRNHIRFTLWRKKEEQSITRLFLIASLYSSPLRSSFTSKHDIKVYNIFESYVLIVFFL